MSTGRGGIVKFNTHIRRSRLTALAGVTVAAAGLAVMAAGTASAGALPGLANVNYSALKGKTIGIIELAPIEPVFRIDKMLISCVKKYGGKTIVAATGGDPAKAAAAADSFNQQGVAGIYNNANSAPALKKQIADANKAKRPFITAWSDQAPGTITIRGLEHQSTARVAQYMIDRLHGQGKILILAADVNQALRQRHAGLLAQLKEFPGIKVVQDYKVDVANAVADAQKATETALQANPDIDAVYGVFDGPSIGAAKAVDAAKSKAFVVGFNGDAEALDMMRNPKSSFAATAANDLEGTGLIACAIFAKMFAGGNAPADTIYQDSPLVTKVTVPKTGFAKSPGAFVLYDGS
jgi:ribose transport system substrate-binding protein